jgi:hypothetical protein
LHGALVALAELAEGEAAIDGSSHSIRATVSTAIRDMEAYVITEDKGKTQIFESLSVVEPTVLSGLQSKMILPAACRVIETSATTESHGERIWKRFVDASVRHVAPECHEAAASAAAVVSSFGDCSGLIDR